MKMGIPSSPVPSPTFKIRPLEEHSFSLNSEAGGAPTTQKKMVMSGMGILPVLAIALQEVYFGLLMKDGAQMRHPNVN